MTRKKKDKEKMSDESIKKEEAESSKDGNMERERKKARCKTIRGRRTESVRIP